MFSEIYVAEKLREHRLPSVSSFARRAAADPNAEVPRAGVGLVHEVFRRIAEGERPAPAQARQRRWRFAG
jgi:hypothetical protein